ncbi:DUF6907 domain-containing protein [Streptomyces sp. NPDC060002]|uniref:DUF6907 domain-containing protein n=1 Tax=Streptomyces sp. NPDC060002 TaxID=3347033 RepID=UPI0036783413
MAQSAISQHTAALSGSLPAIPQQPAAGRAYPLPTPRPGSRFVPAALGKPADGQVIVYVECPLWCTQDHIKDWVQHAEDIDHWGDDSANWDSDCITRPGERMLALDARLHSDPVAADPRLRAAHVLMDDETTQVFLTPEMADKTADDLIAMAAQLRHLAQRARQANVSTGGAL